MKSLVIQVVRKHGLAVLCCTVLAACSADRKSVDVLDLLMPLPADLGVERIQHKSVLVPDGRATSPDAQRALQALAPQGITSSAYFKYLPAQGAYRVRINVFTDEKALQAAWVRRYPDDIRAQGRPLDLGDEGFAVGEAVVFRLAGTMVEISAADEASALEAFARRYADWVAQQLRGGR